MMNNQKTFENQMAAGSSGGVRGVLANSLSMATKPGVIFKLASAILSIIIYYCITSAWYEDRCLFNRYNGICRFGSLSFTTFLACVLLLVSEVSLHQISSFKVRRRIAAADVIISAGNTIFYLLLFMFMSVAWLKSDYPPWGHSINCCRIAILLSFLAIFAMAASTGLAYVRFQSGAETAAQFMTEEQLIAEQAQYYDQSGNYIDPNQQQQQQQLQSQQQYAMDPSTNGANNQYDNGNYYNNNTYESYNIN